MGYALNIKPLKERDRQYEQRIRNDGQTSAQGNNISNTYNEFARKL